MKSASIQIFVKPSEYTYETFEFFIKLDQPLLTRIQEPIHEDDFPIFNPEVVPTNVSFKEKIKITENRDYWSKRLGKIITEKILNTLESKDTVNGYLKSEL